jgi:hypothetical protein
MEDEKFLLILNLKFIFCNYMYYKPIQNVNKDVLNIICKFYESSPFLYKVIFASKNFWDQILWVYVLIKENITL